MKIESRPYVQTRSAERLPKIKMILSGPSGIRVEAMALVDTGASSTVIPLQISRNLGLKLGDQEQSTVANGETVRSFISTANLAFQCPSSGRCFALQDAEVLVSNAEFLILGFDILSIFNFGFCEGQIWFEPPVDKLQHVDCSLPMMRISD